MSRLTGPARASSMTHSTAFSSEVYPMAQYVMDLA